MLCDYACKWLKLPVYQAAKIIKWINFFFTISNESINTFSCRLSWSDRHTSLVLVPQDWHPRHVPDSNIYFWNSSLIIVCKNPVYIICIFSIASHYNCTLLVIKATHINIHLQSYQAPLLSLEILSGPIPCCHSNTFWGRNIQILTLVLWLSYGWCQDESECDHYNFVYF